MWTQFAFKIKFFKGENIFQVLITTDLKLYSRNMQVTVDME